MKKIATITFHRAHNFGSVLQTYALQEFIKLLGEEYGEEIEYQLIDLYSKKQEELYAVLKKNDSIKNIIKNIIVLPYLKDLNKKYNKFTSFIEKNFYLTKRYINQEEIFVNPPRADYYISGSDQIWNVRAMDFLPSYYLNFVKSGKKISYAASFGPLKIDWNKYPMKEIAEYLKKYDYISVRENGSAENIKKLINKKYEINVDPTLLLKKEQWKVLQSDANYNRGKYILLYCLEPSKEQLEMANKISKKLNLPILILKYNNKNDMFNNYIKKYDSGPEDFLSYLDNAALVLSSSFHGTVFSLIYHKPFYVFGGMKDNRISTLLTKMEMVERSLDKLEEIERVNLLIPNHEKIEKVLNYEREKSKEYLEQALEIKKRIK